MRDNKLVVKPPPLPIVYAPFPCVRARLGGHAFGTVLSIEPETDATAPPRSEPSHPFLRRTARSVCGGIVHPAGSCITPSTPATLRSPLNASPALFRLSARMSPRIDATPALLPTLRVGLRVWFADA